MTTAPQPAAPARTAVPRLGRRITTDRDIKIARILHAIRTGDEDLMAAEIEAALPDEVPAADPLDEIRATLAALKEQIAALQAWKEASEQAPAAAAAIAEEVQAVAEAAAEVAEESLPDELVTDAAFRDTVSRAEILAPGLGVPTGDAIATPQARGATIVAHQRKALDKAYDAHPALRPLFGTATKPTFDTMPALTVRGYFIAASEQVRRANTRPPLPTGFTPTADAARSGVPTLADINARAREVWSQRQH